MQNLVAIDSIVFLLYKKSTTFWENPRMAAAGATLQSVHKETQILKILFWGVEIIDCIYDSISVASPFNKEP